MLWGQPAVEDLAKQLVPSVVFVRERSLHKPSPEPADVIAEIQAFVKLVSGSAVRVPVVIITDDYQRARYFGTLPEFHDCIMPYVFVATQQRRKGIPKKHTIMALLADASEEYHDRSMLLDVHHTEFFHRVEYTSCMTTPHLDASLVHAYDLMLRFAQKAEEGVGLDLPLVVWEWNMGVEDTKLHVDLALAAKGLGHSYVSLYNGKGQANKQRARMAEKEADFNAVMDVYAQVGGMAADDTYTYKHEILLRMHLTKHTPDGAVSYMSSTVGYDVGTLSGFEAQHVTTVEVKKHHVIDGHGVFAKTAIKKNEHVCEYYGTVRLNASPTEHTVPNGYLIDLDLPKTGSMFVMEMLDCTAKNINSNLGAEFNVRMISHADDDGRFTMEIVALLPISKGEELNLDYGSDFDWSNKDRKSWLPQGQPSTIDPATLSSSTSSSGSSSTGSSSSAVDSLSLSHCLTAVHFATHTHT
jgi:hypothetical protein